MTCWRWLTTTGFLLGVGLLLCLTQGARTADLDEQRDKQRMIKGETERVVRRIEMLLAVMDYDQVEESAEKRLLEQVNKELTGLSKEQMTALIAALEAME